MREYINIISESSHRENLLRWFGNSVIVDANGEPKRVFHGTSHNIDKFEKGKRGAGSRESGIGYWFTSNTKASSSFANFATSVDGSGPNTTPVYLRIEKPLYLDDYDDLRDLVDNYTVFNKPNYKVGGRQIRMMGDVVDYDRMMGDLKKKYDGIIISNTLTDSPDGITPIDQIIVFDRNQIKSAISNTKFTNSDYISEEQ